MGRGGWGGESAPCGHVVHGHGVEGDGAHGEQHAGLDEAGDGCLVHAVASNDVALMLRHAWCCGGTSGVAEGALPFIRVWFYPCAQVSVVHAAGADTGDGAGGITVHAKGT